MKVNGQAGRVLEVLGAKATNVGVLADCTGFSKAQVRAAMGRLKRLGLVTHEATDVWRRVEQKPLIGVGDRVRFTGVFPGSASGNYVGVVVDLAHRFGIEIRRTSGRYAPEPFFVDSVCELERLSDEDAVPFLPKPARPSGYVVQQKPATPWELRTPYQQRGWAP